MESGLDEADVRAIVSMLGQALSGDGEIALKRARILEGVADLIGATSWIWTRTGFEPGEDSAPSHPKTNVLVRGGFSEEQFATYLESQRHPDMAWMAAPILEAAEKHPGRITRLRQQLHPVEVMEQAEVSRIMARAGIGPTLISQRKTSWDDTIAAILFFRPDGHPEFSEREAKIAHIILTEIEWLHESSWPEYPDEALANLPIRFAGILNLLLEGRQRKRIAEQLNLSEHTVSDYVKAIYKHFDVHSHAELMHRITKGDGGEVDTLK